MKRHVYLLLVAVLVLGLALPTTIQAQGEERVKLRILSSRGQGEFPEGSDESNNIFVDYLRSVTPYDYEYTFYKDASDRNALIASGNQYDMVRLGGGEGLDLLKLQQQGYLAPLDEAIQSANYLLDPAQTPASAWNRCTIDGKRYAVPCSWMELYYSIAVRTDWMEKLGLSTPKTIDEFKQMLIAFRDGDPDGNGANDTIPMTSFGDIGALLPFFRGLYGIQGEYMDVEGQVTYTLTEPQAREMVGFMAGLYAEQLLDMEFATMTGELAAQKITSDQAAVCWTAWWDMKIWNKTFAEYGFEEAPFWWMDPPADIDGNPAKFQPSGPIEQLLCFPVGGHTAEAIDYVNTTLNPEVAETLTFGFEGTHWDRDAEGNRFLTEAYNDIVWRWHYCDGIMFQYDMMAESENLEYGAYRLPIQGYSAGEAGWSLPLPPIAGIEQQQTDINEHALLELTKFVMGERPMEEYDAFVEELNGLGLNEVLAAMQQVYEAQ